MDNALALFMKEANQHWKPIAESLRAVGHNPTACLEAARSAKQGMHHDKPLADAFNAALETAKSAAAITKIERKKTRHARTG